MRERKRRFYSYVAIMELGADSIGVRFPDLPGAFSLGETIDRAQENAKECLIDHIHLLLQDGDPLPNATDESGIEYDPATERLCRIDVDMAELYPEEYGITATKMGGARQGAGRPRLPDAERSSRAVVVRLTEAEYAALDEIARNVGTSKSAIIKGWIRNTMSDETGNK